MTKKLLQRLQDPAKSGVYRAGSGAALQEAMREAPATLSFERIGLNPKDRLMRDLAAALAFPDWFGANWDALEDFLCDLSWRPARGHVLVFDNPGAMPGDDLGVLIDVLRSAAEFWTGQGRPFFAVFIDGERSLALPDLYREP